MKAKVYVDGSYNAATKVYGAGAVLFLEGREDPLLLSQPGNVPQFAASRNIAGEILAVVLVVEACKKISDLEELVIYYDYAGIECWAKGLWKANTLIARTYQHSISDLPFRLSFRKVKAHSGNVYNERADSLAKAACGL